MKYEILRREDAAAAGLKRFYTGRPCKYGHDSQRFVTTGSCVACNTARAKKFSDTFRAARAGLFCYDLHPDDVAAALAYCQALDMARGRKPQVPSAAASPAPQREEEIAAMIKATRDRIAAPLPPPGRTEMAPEMAAQLRAAGLLK